MCKYITVRTHAKDSAHYKVTARNIICSTDGKFVYGEFIGEHSKTAKDLRKIIDEIKDKNGISVVMDGGESIVRNREATYKSKIESLTRGQGYAVVYDESALRGKNSNIIIGRNTNEISALFKKWLSESQPLPYPRGFNEDLGKEAEQYLFETLISSGLITQLSTDFEQTIQAFEISTELLNAGEEMQKAILKVVKDSNLLEIDRLRKILKTAPAIGESDTEAAKVYGSLLNTSTKRIYHIIEYDKYSDMTFCLVNDGGEILWEEHGFEEIFNDEQIAVLKDEEYRDITLDVDGNISKAA